MTLNHEYNASSMPLTWFIFGLWCFNLKGEKTKKNSH